MRLPPLDPSELDPQLEEYYHSGERGQRIVQGLGRRPETLRRWLDLYYSVVRDEGALSLQHKELIRNQLARLFQCQMCQQLVLPEAEVEPSRLAKILDPDDSFGPDERALLRFSRNLHTGPEQVGPEDFAEMRKHFSDEQITEAGFVVSFFAAAGRLNFGFGVFD
mgnify:CR=1 FL=1